MWSKRLRKQGLLKTDWVGGSDGGGGEVMATDLWTPKYKFPLPAPPPFWLRAINIEHINLKALLNRLGIIISSGTGIFCLHKNKQRKIFEINITSREQSQ